MEEGNEKMESMESMESQIKQEIYSKSVRAGKRTYFFDVKATRRNDYYLTITESKKRFGKDGKSFYEKHKIFLYKEDFEKFAEGLNEVVEYIKTANPQLTDDVSGGEPEAAMVGNYTNVDFDDLEEEESK